MDIRPIGNTYQPLPASVDRGAAASGSPPVGIRVADTPADASGVVQTAIAATPVGAAQSGADATQAASGFQADHASVQKAVDEINQAMKALAQEGIEFTIDKDTKFDVVKIIDKETNQVIRQLPSQTTIEIAKALDKLQGLLIKQEA